MGKNWRLTLRWTAQWTEGWSCPRPDRRMSIVSAYNMNRCSWWSPNTPVPSPQPYNAPIKAKYNLGISCLPESNQGKDKSPVNYFWNGNECVYQDWLILNYLTHNIRWAIKIGTKDYGKNTKKLLYVYIHMCLCVRYIHIYVYVES